MVQDRREPTISTIKPERDEIASHQDRLNNQTRPDAAQPRSSGSQKGNGSAMVVFAFLLALVGIGVGAFSVWQLQVAKQSLASAGDRIAELEARLNLTSTESDQSVTKIQEKLEWADSEIRKLWGVSHDTNRKAIQANKNQLNELDKVARTAAEEAEKAHELASSQEKTLTTLRSQASEQQLLVSRADEKIETLEQQLRETTDKAAGLENQLSELQNSIATRVADNEEAIKAIDAFRRSANSDIQTLKERVVSTP